MTSKVMLEMVLWVQIGWEQAAAPSTEIQDVRSAVVFNIVGRYSAMPPAYPSCQNATRMSRCQRSYISSVPSAPGVSYAVCSRFSDTKPPVPCHSCHRVLLHVHVHQVSLHLNPRLHQKYASQ